MHFYEDLVTIQRSVKLIDAAVNRKDRVLNVENKRRGVTARRGDGTFGEIIPGETPILDPGYLVARGPIATVEIGVEIKILAKAMIKQIDRVINDLRNQVTQFKRGGGRPICVAIVGINCADHTVGYEGETISHNRHSRFLAPLSRSAGSGAAVTRTCRSRIRRVPDSSL